jgi:hypothetical protein
MMENIDERMEHESMMKSLQNLGLFKLGWVACVYFAAVGQISLSLLAVGIVVAIHLARTPVPAKEAFFLACAGLLGLGWESVVVSTGLLQYTGQVAGTLLAPSWIVAMWLLFGTTINHGFSWIKRHWAIGAVFGLVGGPMAFYGGSMMNAVTFTQTLPALLLLGAGWAILLPLLCLVSDTITDSELLEPPVAGAGRDVVRLRDLPATQQEVVSHG